MRDALGKVGIILVALAVSGCDMSICSDVLIPGISVTLMDSAAAAPVVADSVVAIAIDGAYADTVRGSPPSERVPKVALAYERPGRYRVEVMATGYRPWSRSGIRVYPDECHVRTVEFVAWLQR